MHTHSPVLQGEPADPAARATALVQLADAYTNALLAASERAGELGADGAVCNLVPVAGSIFAGAFRRGRYFAVAHLDPSYTLVAIVVAIAQARADGAALPALTLCCFDRDVAERAAEVRNAFGASLAGG